MNSSFTLDGDWELAYFPECSGMPQSPEELQNWNCSRIPAQVPGNVEFDLGRAGEIPPENELMKGLNIKALQKYECYQWWYTRKFSMEELPADGSFELIFDGIDCFGTVWLNGIELGRTRNAKIRYKFDVTKALKQSPQENVLTVRIAAPLNMVRDKDYDGCYGYSAKFESVYIRKPYHAFGTDICPRVLSAGLWRSVSIRRKDKHEIRDFYVYTHSIRDDGVARLFVEAFLDIPGYSYDGYTVHVRCVCGDSITHEKTEFSRELTFGYIEIPWIEIQSPKLWYPAGLGEQPLYDVTLEVFHYGKLVASKTVKHGIRMVELERTDLNLPEKPGRFLFKINDIPVFVRGSNWIWADIFHSRDRKTLMKKLELFKEANCNMVRVHGGGVYEPEEFYDFCDRNGIMVWQDLGMSGIAYPQNDEFAELISEEVRFAVKMLRTHPSIVLWCGDNEADQGCAFVCWRGKRLSPDDNRITRKVLPDLLRKIDPFRPFLPSSPYLTGECAQRVMTCKDGYEKHYIAPEAHIWGPRDYCKSEFYYTRNRTVFASEAGFPGVSNLSLLKKYLSPGHVWPAVNNPEWNYHATESFHFQKGTYFRVAQMFAQVERFFDEIPMDVETFIKASQIVQAESDKFLMEFYRQRKWDKTGILIWNMVDSWPQTISDAWVDYELHRKLVFYYMRRSNRPFLLLCAEPENGKIPLIAANDTGSVIDGTAEIILPDFCRTYKFAFHAAPNSNARFGELPLPDRATLILLKWNSSAQEHTGCNHYVSGTAPLPFRVYFEKWLPQIAALDHSFDAEKIGE
ncbi:MAG: sugar-binding domain-containing protein [Victivallales bacterium]